MAFGDGAASNYRHSIEELVCEHANNDTVVTGRNTL